MLILYLNKRRLYNSIKQVLFLVMGMSISIFCSAQKIGGNAPSVQWMQLNNDSLRIIFPQGNKEKARTVLNTSTYMLKNERSSIGQHTQKFNIILQPHTVKSNGFVTLGPFRAVFLTTPSQDNFGLGTTNWLNQLGIHETWHALQYMNFKTGLANTFHTLFGESGQALIDNQLIPGWYWEGEAVFMETQLTLQGRGRSPSFLDPYKALWLSNTDYNYAKIRNGSLKDLVPNKYVSGYMTVAYGRNKYGNNFWHPIMQKALLNKKFINPFNQKHPDKPFHLFQYGFYPLDAALNYYTGKKIKAFYYASIKHFKDIWEQKNENKKFTKVDTLKTATKNTVLNYTHPISIGNGKTLALKYGYAQLPKIIEIDTSGKENVVVPIGNSTQQYYSYGGNKIVWTEYRPNLRWGWKDYSILKIYDLETKQSQTLTHHSKYFSPDLSPNGQKVAAVNVTQNNAQIDLLKTKDGEKIKSLPNPNNYFYTYPKFSLNGKYIISGARDTLSNMALVKINIQTGAQTILTPFAPKPIGPVSISKDFIYFPAGFKHNVQIYALRINDNKIFRVTKRPIGDYSVTIDSVKDKILFTEYAVQGFQLLSTTKDSSSWTPVSKESIAKVYNPYVPKALSYYDNKSILKKISPQKASAQEYHPFKHLFRIRSWYFESVYPETSILLSSRDLMGKMQASAGIGYNFNENTPFLKANLLYGGIFPFLQLGFKKTFQRHGLLSDSTTIHWNETNWSAGFRVPLNLSAGLYHRYLSISGAFHQGILNYTDYPQSKKNSKTINYYSLGLSFNNLRNQTIQDINPKIGFALSLEYDHTLWTAKLTDKFNAHLNIFLPGLFSSHSLYFTSGYSFQKNNDFYKFNDDFNYATGYNSIPYNNIYNLGIHYQLPLCYPDIGLPWIYLSRIRLHLFYEYSHATLPSYLPQTKATFRSVGGALYLDTRIFKKSIPIGLQYAYLIDRDPKTGKHFNLSLNFPMDLFFQ